MLLCCSFSIIFQLEITVADPIRNYYWKWGYMDFNIVWKRARLTSVDVSTIIKASKGLTAFQIIIHPCLWIICHKCSVSYFIVCLYSYKYSHDCIDLVTLALTYHSTVVSARSGYGMSNLFPSLSLRDILRRVVILGCWGSMKLISPAAISGW